MKRIYTLIILSFMLNEFRSQTFSWAKDEGAAGYDYGMGVTTDNSGNIYMAGKYEQCAVFSGSTINCSPNYNHDIYLAKYAPSGSLTWIRTAGGPIGDYAHAVACDGTGNVVIAGEIEGAPTDVIAFSNSTITLNPVYDNDFVLAKYDLNGNLQWALREGGNGSEKAEGVCMDNSGNIYAVGHFLQPITWNGTTTTNSAGMEDCFLVKYDANGIFQWVRTIGGPGRDEVKGVKCDAAGNVYAVGYYSDQCVFGTTTYSTSGNSAYLDIFLVKYDPSGNLVWTRTAGETYDDAGWGITIDNAGLIYITGEFNAAIYFGTTQVVTNGNSDAFVACYDQNGNVIWAKGGGGPLYDRARGIGNFGNNIFITGQFGGTAAFGSTNIFAADSSDVFFATLTNSGTFINASSVGGAPDAPESLGFESGQSICADPAGVVYASGALLNGGTFGSTVLGGYGKTDAFLTRIDQMVGINTITNSRQKNIHVYPNPGTGNFTIDFDDQVTTKYELNVINCLGQTVDTKLNKGSSKTTLDLSDLENGVYFVEIKDNNKTISTKKIIIHR
jgi:hypothetical protein